MEEGKCKRANDGSAEVQEQQKRSKQTDTDPSTQNAATVTVSEAKSCLEHEDVWTGNDGIFSFLGMGHYAFVAPVSHKMKDLYTTYCDYEENPPYVKSSVKSRPGNESAPPKGTMDSAIVSSVPRAEYWFTHHYAGGGEEFARSSICVAAAKEGNVAVLHWARNKGLDWDVDVCRAAAQFGHLDVLKYAHENGCPWDVWTCMWAAHGNHLDVLKDVLKYAHEKDCPWDERMICWVAAGEGHLEVLKYARANGCRWDATTCSSAALGGHLEVLKYAHEHGCPWDATT